MRKSETSQPCLHTLIQTHLSTNESALVAHLFYIHRYYGPLGCYVDFTLPLAYNSIICPFISLKRMQLNR